MEIILPLSCLLLFVLAGLIVILHEYREKDRRDGLVMVMVRNNENTCEGVIRQLFSSKAGRDSNFLIIDDQSSDKTAEIIKCLARERANVELVYRDNLTRESHCLVRDFIPHRSLTLDLRENRCA